jgi:hypothetical protein
MSEETVLLVKLCGELTEVRKLMEEMHAIFVRNEERIIRLEEEEEKLIKREETILNGTRS